MSTDLDPAADRFHAPTSDDPYFTETCWFAFFVPERKLSGTLYPLFRRNQNVAAVGVYIWDDSAHTPWDARYVRNLWHVPVADDADLADIELTGSLRYRCLSPQRSFKLDYDHPGYFSADLTFDAVMDPHWLGDAHLDQHGRVHGTLVLDGESIAVDCLAIRDRTWSPRNDLSDTVMGTAGNGGYSYAMTDPGNGFHALAVDAGGHCKVVAGYLIRDGVLSDVTDGRRWVIERNQHGIQTRVGIELTDKLGRTYHGEGTCHNGFAWQFTPSLFSWICLTDWHGDGGRGWGEDHDNWSSSAWRRFSRARFEARGE